MTPNGVEKHRLPLVRVLQLQACWLCRIRKQHRAKLDLFQVIRGLALTAAVGTEVQ